MINEKGVKQLKKQEKSLVMQIQDEHIRDARRMRTYRKRREGMLPHLLTIKIHLGSTDKTCIPSCPDCLDESNLQRKATEEKKRKETKKQPTF